MQDAHFPTSCTGIFFLLLPYICEEPLVLNPTFTVPTEAEPWEEFKSKQEEVGES